MTWITDPQAWAALATLTLLEIVLGIDNIVFITILTGRLPVEQRGRGRSLGLLLAMATRIVLLLSLSWVMGLTAPLLEFLSREITGRDLILLGGGLFLLAKSTHEIHNNLEGDENGREEARMASFAAVLVQIAMIDIIFSLDSVITAVGLASHLAIMILAIVISVGVMFFAARAIGEFVENHPTIKMLALSFLILVGFTLMGEGMGMHIPKGYIYFAMAFSMGVEMLNIKMRSRQGRPVKLHRLSQRG